MRCFDTRSTMDLDDVWLRGYRAVRQALLPVALQTVDAAVEPPPPPPVPHAVQSEALAALEATRLAGNRSGLVVMATGLGKTWLAAFDSNRPEFRRVLFVAHREEILAQAMETFRRIRPAAGIGLYAGGDRSTDKELVFASIQTLSRREHLNRFAGDGIRLSRRRRVSSRRRRDVPAPDRSLQSTISARTDRHARARRWRGPAFSVRREPRLQVPGTPRHRPWFAV